MGSILDQNSPAVHVLAIPFFLHGHFTPMLRFMTQVARKGITVSFVCYENAVPGVITSGDESSELQSLDFRFVTVPYPKLPDHTQLADLPRNKRDKLFEESLEPLMEKLIHDKKSGLASPTCIIADLFCPWTMDLAEKLQVPKYVLVPSGVLVARSLQGFLENLESGKFQISERDGRLVEFDWPVFLSGLPPLYYHELIRGAREVPSYFRVIGEAVLNSTGVVVNSFFELEEKVIEAFQNHDSGLEHVKVPKIYPVGPLLSLTAPKTSLSDRGLEDSSSKCLLWLGSQPSSSVLYIAFGSQAILRPEQMTELAHGLEASNQRFLWVLPQKKKSLEEESPSITELLPKDFQARVGDRGCIVTGWAPQLQILAHSATGGFMTHSGWNSTLESIMLGVPMICWPQAAEQFLNCKYLANDLKVAEQLQAGKDNNVERNEIERAVRYVMVQSEGTAMRSRVEELKRKGAEAVAEGGSQSRFLQEFVDDISNHGVSPNSRTN